MLLSCERTPDLHVLVVGGGTATNALTTVFPEVARAITYVVPISDNGGSTSEIIRVVGGPAIGDARSRVTRLMPPSPVRELLEHRLPKRNMQARADWAAIVDGSHPAWNGIDAYIRHMYRAFLIYADTELLRRSPQGNRFKYAHASVGNLLLSGARIFFGSLESAIEFVLRSALVAPTVSVLPCLNTNLSYHIAAILQNQAVIVGQSQISHPGIPGDEAIAEEMLNESEENNLRGISRQRSSSVVEDATMPFAHPSLSRSQLAFSKLHEEPLPGPINRVYYVSQYGAEIRPSCSSRVKHALESAQACVYSIGSLYTSIAPVLICQGFFDRLKNTRARILLLNGTLDRETSTLSASGFVRAIIQSLLYSSSSDYDVPACDNILDWRPYVTHLIYPCPDNTRDQSGSSRVPLDLEVLREHGIECIPCKCLQGAYDQKCLQSSLTHILATIAR